MNVTYPNLAAVVAVVFAAGLAGCSEHGATREAAGRNPGHLLAASEADDAIGDDDAGGVYVDAAGDSSWGHGSTGHGSSTATGSASEGGAVIVVATNDGGPPDGSLPERGECLRGIAGGNGDFVATGVTCQTDTQCRDNNPRTWDRCRRPSAPASVCGHRFLGDLYTFTGNVACTSVADCDDGDAMTDDICARAETAVPRL
jgi:hypothetical protein